MARLVLLAALLAILLGVDRALAAGERARRAGEPPIELLVGKDRREGGNVAAITVQNRDGALFYARKKGLWRSREAHGAVCRTEAIEELLGYFFSARGIERAPSSEGPDYGLGPGAGVVFTIHGPKVLDEPGRDVLFAFEAGRSFAEGGRGRTFVREQGSERILEIDRDPVRLLETPLGALLPPLVDTRLLAGCLPPDFHGFREFRIETPPAGSLRVTLEETARADADAAEPVEWILDRGRGRESFPGWRVGGYIGMWLRARFEECASPSRARDLGADPPAAVVRIFPDGLPPIELWISRVDDRRRAYVWNRTSNVLMVVPDRWQPLLAPEADLFLDAKRPNPWEEWLRKP